MSTGLFIYGFTALRTHFIVVSFCWPIATQVLTRIDEAPDWDAHLQLRHDQHICRRSTCCVDGAAGVDEFSWRFSCT